MRQRDRDRLAHLDLAVLPHLDVGDVADTQCGFKAFRADAARAASVFAMEAMWTRFLPHIVEIRELLAPLRLDDIRLVYGDGMQGHQPNAPYDSIIAAAGGDELPAAWLDQLAVGGRLVSPVRRAGSELLQWRDQVNAAG